MSKALAKRSQHFSTTYCSIVWSNMLRAFGHLVTMCCYMLGIENQTSAQPGQTALCCRKNLTSFKFEPTTPNMLQHIATGWPNVEESFCLPLKTSYSVAEKVNKNTCLCTNQFQRCPSPPPPGNRGAFAHIVSPGGGAFAILSQPGGWALAYPRATSGHLTHVFSK